MSDIIKGKFNLSEGAMMERISVENSQVNLVDIVKRVESGEELMLTFHGRDAAHVVSPGQLSKKNKDFFELLHSIKSNVKINATVDEILEWKEEGRV